MAFYAYYRVSTQSQVEANGTQMQIDVIRKYCTDNGIEIAAEYSDEGISGAIDDVDEDAIHKRKGLMSLLAVLQDGDSIIVQNTSRLWRSDTAKVIVRREIKKAHANIKSVEQPTYDIYKKNPNDFLFNAIMEIFDEYDKLTIAMKLAKGRDAKARKGEKSCGNTPLGYRWTVDAKIEIDYNNHLIVKQIFDKYIETGSYAAVQRFCDANNIKTRKGNSFTRQGIKDIITNDFYIGIVTHAGEKVKGDHPVFIDEETFMKANHKK